MRSVLLVLLVLGTLLSTGRNISSLRNPSVYVSTVRNLLVEISGLRHPKRLRFYRKKSTGRNLKPKASQASTFLPVIYPYNLTTLSLNFSNISLNLLITFLFMFSNILLKVLL